MQIEFRRRWFVSDPGRVRYFTPGQIITVGKDLDDARAATAIRSGAAVRVRRTFRKALGHGDYQNK